MKGKRVAVPLAVVLSLAGQAAARGESCYDEAKARDLYGRLPMRFEANQGQADPQVRFVARGHGYALLLTARESVLALRPPKRDGKPSAPELIRIGLVGSNPSPVVTGLELLPGTANYLIGSDASQWHTDIPSYARVRMAEIYPGISLSYYGQNRQLEYDFEVAPGADPAAIRLRVDGAMSLRIDERGNVRIRGKHGELVQRAPVIYQMKDGVRRPVEGRFRLRGKREIAFDVPRYDRTAALVIDPLIVWSVYLGGDNLDVAQAVAVDPRFPGVAWVTGTTFSSNFCFPSRTPCSFQNDMPNQDAFVTRFRFTTSPTDLFVDYQTYFGGNGQDNGSAIAVDANQQAILAGDTNAALNFPGGPAYSGGSSDAFVAKLNPTGTGIIYSRFIGGLGADVARGIAQSAADQTYVVGETDSPVGTGFPITAGAFQPAPAGGNDAFLTKLDGGGNVLYSTYYGGSLADRAFGVALAPLGGGDVAVYFVGETVSLDFPLKNPLQTSLLGASDAMAVRFDDRGGTFVQSFSSYLGGTSDDSANAVAVDPVVSGDFYVVGGTRSNDFPVFPVLDAFQKTLRGAQNGFVTRISTAAASSVVYSTYLGGSFLDSALGIAVDSASQAYVTGQTLSSDFPIFRPLTTGASLNGFMDAFVTKLVPPGCGVMFSTYLGGSGDERGVGVAVQGNVATVVGQTSSPAGPNPFPTQSFSLNPAIYGTYQDLFGSSDGFVTAITDDPTNGDLAVSKSASPSPTVFAGQVLIYTVTLQNTSPDAPAYGITLTDDLPPGVTFQSVTPAAYCSFSPAPPQVICNFPCIAPRGQPGEKVDVVIKVIPTVAPATIVNRASITTLSVDPDSVPGPNSAVVSTDVLPAADMSLSKSVTSSPTPAVGDIVRYDLIVSNNGPSDAPGVHVTDLMPPGVTYVSSGGPVVCTQPTPGRIECDYTPGTLAASSSFTMQIFGQALATGAQRNEATVSSSDPDLVPGNDTGSASVFVTAPSSRVTFPTVRSKSGDNLLQWVNPNTAGGTVQIHRTTAVAGHCTYEMNPLEPTTRMVDLPYTTNDKASFDDDGSIVGPMPPNPTFPIANDTTYCYTLFTNAAGPRFISGRPFDSTLGHVRWAFNTGTWSMSPPGNGVGAVQAVSNDNVLYAMTKGTAGGTWPIAWIPFGFMNGPSQGRPSTYPFPVGLATSAIFLSSQDGRVYAVDADKGGAAAPAWPPAPLGSTALAHPSGLFLAFGGTQDLIYAASRETPPTSSIFYALKLADGTTAAPGWTQSVGGSVGPVHGQPAVDYASSPPRVYFASRALGPAPNDNTLWCLNAEDGTVIWKKAYGDIDGGVALRGGRLFVATNAGQVIAIDAATGDPIWSGPFNIAPGSEGPAKGFVYAPPLTTAIYFSSTNLIWSINDGGGAWTPSWAAGGVPVASPATPIAIPADPIVWVGSSDGSLHRHDVVTGALIDTIPLGDGTAAVGSPTFDVRNGFLYVGTEAGIVYGVEIP